MMVLPLQVGATDEISRVRLKYRAVAIHDSMNRESIQNPNFQVNREPTIRQNWRTLLLKELIHESRIYWERPE